MKEAEVAWLLRLWEKEEEGEKERMLVGGKMTKRAEGGEGQQT